MTVRVGVVGLGVMGRHHARILSDMDGVELVGVADTNPVVLNRTTRGRQLRGFTDFLELLAQERPAIVVVAVPTGLHHSVALAAMQAGADLLIEKPIASTCAEALDLIEIARQLGRRIAVGHVERFNPAVVALKHRLDSGELGRVFRLHARRMGPFPARIRDVGVVIDLATHDIDVARYLLGAEPTRIFAETARRIHTDHEDMLSALLRFDDSTLVQLDVNWLTPTKIREISVTGERGMFLVNYLTQELLLFENNDAETNRLDPIVGVTEGRMVRFKVEPKEPLRAELEDVVAAIRDGREPLIGPRDAYAALEIAEAIVRSGRTGKVVMMPKRVAASA
jgi:UDP-N-acetylglucosamine 3-dehydrogenase